MNFFSGWPYPVAVAVLFVIVMLRASGTYWLGRVAHRGTERTRASRLLASSGFHRAQRLVARWGAPVVTVSFLTVGIQTLVNLAAGAARMPLRRYLPAMTLGCVAWAFLYATVGFVTVAAWELLYQTSPMIAIILGVTLGGSITSYVLWQLTTKPEPNDLVAMVAPDPDGISVDQ